MRLLIAITSLGALAACGGMSKGLEDEPSELGGSRSTERGTGGVASGGSSSGAAPAGGTIGMTATGGMTTTGGAGYGGTPIGLDAGPVTACAECPAAVYGVVVTNAGQTFVLSHAWLWDFEFTPEPDCQMVRGWNTGGCGGLSLGLSACAGPGFEPPCLSVNGASGRYIDATRREWAAEVVPATEVFSSSPVASGRVSLQLAFAGGSADAPAATVLVEYTVCAIPRTAILCPH